MMPVEIVAKRKKDAPEVKRGEKPIPMNKIPKKEKEKIKEGGLGDLANAAEMDHEVQMARADLYKIAKYAIKLHDMLKTVSEAEGIDGWKQSKITKAADYMGSVYHSMDYDMKFAESKSTKNVMKRSKSMTEEAYLNSMKAKVKKKVDKKVSEKESPAGGPACWDGKKIGSPKTKMKGGKRVNNCIDADGSDGK